MPPSPCRKLLTGLAFLLFSGFSAFAAEADQQVMTMLHMLDYIGVDYPEFVQRGKVLNEAEYEEQQEFAERVESLLGGLPEKAGQKRLLAQAGELRDAIERKVEGSEIATLTAQMSRGLLKTYPVTIAPRQAPDVPAATALFETQCASCHGADGRGAGAIAEGMDPPPANFHDLARQRQRSIFGLYNVITLGVAGTSMPNFAHLSEQERWALAFYVGQMVYSDEQRKAGEVLWNEKGAATQMLDGLKSLTNVMPAELIAAHGEQAENLMAYLRRQPSVVTAAVPDPLTTSRLHMAESLRAYQAGNHALAMQLALSSYLEGFELAEASLDAVDHELMEHTEHAMMDYRELIQKRAPVDAVTAKEAEVQALLSQSQEKIARGGLSKAGSFIGSFVILAREGLEAILVLAAMFAFLRKAERPDTLRYVHIGWVSALVLGIATWFVATYMIDISGATREVTEGYTALLAAAILLSVGLWMHNKSYSNRWQQYVSGKMRGALSGGRLWGLSFLAFIAVYREVFETVLFYRALWAQGDHVAIVGGFLAAAVALVAVSWAIFTYSMKLPIKQFFSWSAAFIVVLAVIFTGKGVAALQEAGTLPVNAIDFVSIPMLGIYPTLQVVGLQVLVLLVVLGGMAWNHLTADKKAA